MSTPLTAEEAANLANLPLRSFRQRMSRLNDTPDDLRTPRQPGERARRYDAKKIARWIESGLTTTSRPKNLAKPPAKNATTYTGTATRHSRQISAHFKELDLTVTARNTAELEELAQLEIAERFKTPLAQVRVILEFDLPEKTKGDLAQLTEAKQQVKELQQKITDLQKSTAADLLALGWKTSEIAEVLGVTSSRVYQILNNE